MKRKTTRTRHSPKTHSIQTHTFENGFRVVYEAPYNGMDISDIRVYCRVGSAYETDELRGASHFIEHMCFKGTDKLPTSRDISVRFDEVGAYLNATTDKQYTYYSISTYSKYTQRCLETVADMMLHSTFPKGEYEKELDVVIEENVKSAAEPEDIMYEKLDKMIYAGTPYSDPVDTLSYHRGVHERDLLDRKRMLAFYRQYYVPENMMLSIVSSYSFSTILNILGKTAFPRLRRGGEAPVPPVLNHHGDPHHPTRALPPSTATQTDYTLHLHSIPTITSTHIAIGFRTCNLYDEPTRCVLHVLSTILGGTFMSRLFLVLREKHGLTYSSGTDVEYYENTGGFFIHATTDTAKLLRNGTHKGVLPVLMDLLKDLVEKGISKKEGEYVQHFLEGKIRMNTELSDHQCSYNANQIFLLNKTEDTIVPYFRLYEDVYKNITPEQIHQVIRQYFTRDNMFITIHGGRLPSETSIRKEIERFPLPVSFSSPR